MKRILTITSAAVRRRDRPPPAGRYPETIPLPNGWQPEGIATGFGNQFFAGAAPPAASSRAT